MTQAHLSAALDAALAALIGMRVDEIETYGKYLAAMLSSAQPDAILTPKLKRVRAAAVQAAQLWHLVLPETGRELTYTREGSADTSASEPDLSIVG